MYLIFKGFIYNGKKNAPKTHKCPMPFFGVRGVCDKNIKKNNHRFYAKKSFTTNIYERTNGGCKAWCPSRDVRSSYLSFLDRCGPVVNII
jgi:hypothetical protein